MKSGPFSKLARTRCISVEAVPTRPPNSGMMQVLQAGGAPSLHGMNMHGQAIALLDPVDGNRAVLSSRYPRALGNANRTPAPDSCLVCPSSTSSLRRLRSREPTVSVLFLRSDARPASGQPANH